MDANVLTTLISQMGFPIVAFLLMWWYMLKQNENHKREIDGMKDALNNNTIALNKLIDRMDGGDRS